MRYAPDQKEKTRARILESAATAFRRQGYHATGVDKVMEEAGPHGRRVLRPLSLERRTPGRGARALCRPKLGEARPKGLPRRSDPEQVGAIVDRYLTASSIESSPRMAVRCRHWLPRSAGRARRPGRHLNGWSAT